MVGVRKSDFLIEAKGDDNKMALVKFNDGTTKPMKRAKKRCLDDALKLRKLLHHTPSREEWGDKERFPHLFCVETVEEIYGGSFDELIRQVELKCNPPMFANNEGVVIEPTKVKTYPRVGRGTAMQYGLEDLAKFLQAASAGKDQISPDEYNKWRLRQSGENKPPHANTIRTRLGRV